MKPSAHLLVLLLMYITINIKSLYLTGHFVSLDDKVVIL